RLPGDGRAEDRRDDPHARRGRLRPQVCERPHAACAAHGVDPPVRHRGDPAGAGAARRGVSTVAVSAVRHHGAVSPTVLRTLTADEARAARRTHEERADALTAAHRERKLRGEKHAVEDFLFTYYPFSPARLRRWHPGWRAGYAAVADLGADVMPVIADV